MAWFKRYICNWLSIFREYQIVCFMITLNYELTFLNNFRQTKDKYIST